MIHLLNFRKLYGNKVVVKSDDITFENNKISFIMGPNGAGKTTLIKCISSLEDYCGEIVCDNIDDMFVIWDDTPFYDKLSGLKNLILLCGEKYTTNEICEKASQEMDFCLLNRKVKTYSYGQRKMLALVAAKILNPKVLIMDEISNGLDYETMLKTKKVLKTMTNNSTIILTGHQLSFYNDIADDIFVINHSELKHYVQSEEKKNDLEAVYYEEFLSK